MKAREATIDDVVEVNSQIKEFLDNGKPYKKEFFENRLSGRINLKLVTIDQSGKIGYLVAYDRYNDGSFYCWMVGVPERYRRQGVLKGLMQYLDVWAKRNGYKNIRIRTRAKRKEMLSYLAQSGFRILSKEEKGSSEDCRINLKKELT